MSIERAMKLRARADTVRKHREAIDGKPDGEFAKYEQELRDAADIVERAAKNSAFLTALAEEGIIT